MTVTKTYQQPDAHGYYGNFGGAFIPEMLYPNVKELQDNYLKIIYEDDISESSKHQETANKVFRFLGLKEHKVKTEYKKVLPQDLKKILNNYDEVYNYFKETKYSEFLK